VPVITTTSTANVGVSSSVNYLETGLKLDVEPNVYLDDEVAIKVQLEVSNILEQLNISGTVAYRLGTRNAATTLRLRDGETQVLAGLISNEDRRSVARVPYLGDVPVFGRLFSNNNDQKVKSEIVLLITPRIIRNVVRPDAVASQFSSGTEAVPGALPMRLAVATRMNMTPLPAPTVATAAAAAASAAVRPAAAAGQSFPLVVAAPTQVGAGDEFAMTFTLVGDQAVTSRVELNYDPKALALLPGAAPAAPLPGAPPVIAAPATQNDPGHAMFDIKSAGLPGAPPTSMQLRFKAIASRTLTTRIGIEAIGNGAAISAPDAHTLNIVARQP
jgi:general secretion pathway protein D